jgi:hypothetical protein
VTTLAPFVTAPNDIYGRDDLEALLDPHEHVERRHVKLWLASGAQLGALLQPGVAARSRVLAERVQRMLPRYVQGEAFAEGTTKLDQGYEQRDGRPSACDPSDDSNPGDPSSPLVASSKVISDPSELLAQCLDVVAVQARTAVDQQALRHGDPPRTSVVLAQQERDRCQLSSHDRDDGAIEDGTRAGEGRDRPRSLATHVVERRRQPVSGRSAEEPSPLTPDRFDRKIAPSVDDHVEGLAAHSPDQRDRTPGDRPQDDGGGDHQRE